MLRALPTELSRPMLAVSIFCQYCLGVPVRSLIARDHNQVYVTTWVAASRDHLKSKGMKLFLESADFLFLKISVLPFKIKKILYKIMKLVISTFFWRSYSCMPVRGFSYFQTSSQKMVMVFFSTMQHCLFKVKSINPGD